MNLPCQGDAVTILSAADTKSANLKFDRGLRSHQVLLVQHTKPWGGQLQAHFTDHSLNFVAA